MRATLVEDKSYHLGIFIGIVFTPGYCYGVAMNITLLCFEYELASIGSCVWTLGPYFVVFFRKVVEPVGDRTLVEACLEVLKLSSISWVVSAPCSCLQCYTFPIVSLCILCILCAKINSFSSKLLLVRYWVPPLIKVVQETGPRSGVMVWETWPCCS